MKPINLFALLLFIASATWVLTRSDSVVRDIQAIYFRVISPALKSGSAMETYARNFLAETKHSKILDAELSSAKPELGRLRIIESRFKELEQENDQLRRAMNFVENNHFDVVAARVTRRHPTTWWQTMEIDVGEEKGIGTQLSVLSEDGLVGMVDRPFENRSSVLLITDEKCQVSVRVDGTPEVGIVSGQRGEYQNNPTLKLIALSKNASLKTGQRVYTTGRGGIFQPNVLVGSIISVERGSLDSVALVRPAVNFSDLGIVFVVLTKNN